MIKNSFILFLSSIFIQSCVSCEPREYQTSRGYQTSGYNQYDNPDPVIINNYHNSQPRKKIVINHYNRIVIKRPIYIRRTYSYSSYKKNTEDKKTF